MKKLFVTAVILAMLVVGLTSTASAVSGAAFTTVNETVDGTGNCLNGNPLVNCNIYTGKQYVWLNGGPSVAYVGDGTYFFAVLVPGGQADPNDGNTNNLSSPNDAYTNRTFTVSNGTVSYSGTHDFANNEIRLMPYDDTTNPGGVYILAVCSLGSGYPVDASTCKYDAFKVQTGTEIQHGLPLTVAKDASGAYTDTFTWGISKNVDQTTVDIAAGGAATFNYTVSVTHDSGTVSGVTVSGTISVFNPNVDSSNNPVSVSGVNVTDQLSDGTTCDVANGSDATLTAFQTDFAYSCSLSGLPQGELDNTVTVTWPQQLLDNGALLDAGSADFTFSNIGFTANNVDNCVSVSDTLGGTLGQVCSTDPSPTTFTYPHTFNGAPAGTCTNYDNTATFTTNTTGTTGSASQTVTVCVGADLKVSKTAVPSFDSSINKSVDKTIVKQVGGSATFNYVVAVTESNWQVTGVITVSNPNDWEAVTLSDVMDAVDNGGNCALNNPTDGTQTVAASGSVNIPYTCTYASAPTSSSGTNVATAHWSKSTYVTPNGYANGSKGFQFTPLTVVDTYAGTLGTIDPPAATTTFKYSRTITVPQFGCQTYPNTATIVQTGQTSSQSVTVCGPAHTGALTMGFWQNKNGQGIISGSNQALLGAWLRQFHPFSDAPSTGLASYVYNIIKAANASGSSMNAMLRGQMLATSLDAYFSDPLLGGNKINAPGPIGGVMIDLTKICHMIDGSGGTATCSGTYENVSSAFGGATSMSVISMLLYQNTADPLADKGAVWYNQVKATQQLAKDAFDAINNQVAFAP